MAMIQCQFVMLRDFVLYWKDKSISEYQYDKTVAVQMQRNKEEKELPVVVPLCEMLLPTTPSVGQSFSLNGHDYVVHEKRYRTEEQDNPEMHCSITLVDIDPKNNPIRREQELVPFSKKDTIEESNFFDALDPSKYESNVEKSNAKLTKKLAEANIRIDKLKQATIDVAVERNELEETVTSLKERNEEISEDISELKEILREKECDLVALRGDDDCSEQVIANLNKDVDELKSQKNALYAARNELIQTVDSLKEENKEFEGERNVLSNEAVRLNKRIGNLIKIEEDLRQTNHNQRDTIRLRKQEANAFKQNVTVLKAQVFSLNEKVTDFAADRDATIKKLHDTEDSQRSCSHALLRSQQQNYELGKDLEKLATERDLFENKLNKQEEDYEKEIKDLQAKLDAKVQFCVAEPVLPPMGDKIVLSDKFLPKMSEGIEDHPCSEMPLTGSGVANFSGLDPHEVEEERLAEKRAIEERKAKISEIERCRILKAHTGAPGFYIYLYQIDNPIDNYVYKATASQQGTNHKFKSLHDYTSYVKQNPNYFSLGGFNKYFGPADQLAKQTLQVS